MNLAAESINNHVNGWINVVKTQFGLSNSMATLSLIGIIILAGFILFFVIRPFVLMIFSHLSNREKSVWLKAAYKQHVFHRITWIIPGIVVLIAAPILSSSKYPLAESLGNALVVTAGVYLTGIVSMVLAALLNTVQARFLSFKMANRYSIKSYIQVCKIVLFILTAIVIVSILVGKSPLYLLTGLGAMTAVIMLVFRDSILGFVASIQLSAYDIIRVGDWIEIPKYNVNGTVTDISLNTLKVTNFDNTIVTIPSYVILTESVQNWRGMTESGGRRIKRNLTVNINTVKFCSTELLARLSTLSLLKDKMNNYLDSDIHHIDPDVAKMLQTDPRAISNLTLFKLYIEAYLASHPCINTNMTFLIRELQNEKYGVPIEIYVFSNITDWVKYEAIQASIFDYLYSMLPVFELESYQYRSETKKGFALGVD